MGKFKRLHLKFSELSFALYFAFAVLGISIERKVCDSRRHHNAISGKQHYEVLLDIAAMDKLMKALE